jgi:tetrahydromethanopterin S-methyltransferase subunit E
MKRNIKIACYSFVIAFCIVAAAYLALLLVPNKTVVIVVPILFSLVLANGCFF